MQTSKSRYDVRRAVIAAFVLLTMGIAVAPHAASSDTGTFLVVFDCDARVLRALFPHRIPSRIEPLPDENFRVGQLGSFIARLAGVRAGELRYATSVALFADHIPTALSTASGNGLLLRATRRGALIELGVCAAQGSGPVRHLATQRLDDTSVLLIGIELDGQPRVAAIRCEALDSAALHDRQKGFREETALSPVMLTLQRIEVPPGGARCLEAR